MWLTRNNHSDSFRICPLHICLCINEECWAVSYCRNQKWAFPEINEILKSHPFLLHESVEKVVCESQSHSCQSYRCMGACKWVHGSCDPPEITEHILPNINFNVNVIQYFVPVNLLILPWYPSWQTYRQLAMSQEKTLTAWESKSPAIAGITTPYQQFVNWHSASFSIIYAW